MGKMMEPTLQPPIHRDVGQFQPGSLLCSDEKAILRHGSIQQLWPSSLAVYSLALESLLPEGSDSGISAPPASNIFPTV